MSEIPRPPDRRERERAPPEAYLVNFDAFSDEELVGMYQGLMKLPDATNLYIGDKQLKDRVFDRIAESYAGYASRNPERAEAMLRGLIYEIEKGREDRPYYDKDVDRMFVAFAVPGLVQHDYEFTRDTLTSLVTSPFGTYTAGGDYSLAAPIAAHQLSILMRDLPYEQAVDISIQLNSLPEYGLYDNPINPAPPEAAEDSGMSF